tara:strand:+ start:4475 stop:5716 length:1242 start_codon:yes stop_codon:yes gene_type:complete
MAINIPSLFSDIIGTDEQRRLQMLQEGDLLARQLTGNLRTGAGASLGQRLTATAGPTITAIAGQLPQRREDIRRAAGGMLGLDVRTEEEKLEDLLKDADLSTPEDLVKLSTQIQDIRPAQALQLRRAALEERRTLNEQERVRLRQEEADKRAERSLGLSEGAAARAERAEERQIAKDETTAELQASAEARAVEQAGRNKTNFQNSVISFEQSQEDREAERAAADSLRASLINSLPTDSPYQDVLQAENTYIPLQQLRLINNDNISQQTPNIELRNIYDPETEKNMVVRINRDTGEMLGSIAEVQRTTPERNVPALSKDRRLQIEEALDGSEILKDNNLYALMGGGTGFLSLGPQEKAGKALAADLVHSYSKKQNVSLTEVIRMLEEQIKDEAGKINLRTGKIETQEGEWGIKR